MSIVYDSVVSVAKEIKSAEATLEKAVADIFEAEPRLYDLYLVEKEYDDTHIEKSGTTEGAIAGWDTKGREQKESVEEKYKRLRAIADVKVKEPWRKKLADKTWDEYLASISVIDSLTGYPHGINPYRSKDAMTVLQALKIVLLGDYGKEPEDYVSQFPKSIPPTSKETDQNR